MLAPHRSLAPAALRAYFAAQLKSPGGGCIMIMRAAAGAVALALLSLLPIRGDARTAAVRDLVRIVRLSDPRSSPDGKSLALVETRANVDLGEFELEILLVDLARGEMRPLTHARRHARSPRWSQSGDRIAFLAPDSDKVTQLFIMPMAGGDALQLTQARTMSSSSPGVRMRLALPMRWRTPNRS